MSLLVRVHSGSKYTAVLWIWISIVCVCVCVRALVCGNNFLYYRKRETRHLLCLCLVQR